MAGCLKGVRRADWLRWRGRRAVATAGARQAGQALELAALAADLMLEGGELARGPGVETLGGLASLLQIGPQRGGLLLGVCPERQERVALPRKLNLSLGQERRQGRLSTLLEALRGGFDTHETDHEGVDPLVQGTSLGLAGLGRVRRQRLPSW